MRPAVTSVTPPPAAAVPAEPGELVVLAAAQWPDGSALPPLAGFIVSSFSPLAAELAERCLRRYLGGPPADEARGERTAIVLASSTGDLATAAAVAAAVDERRRVPPLLFYQSNPNAVAGYIAARWGLRGPVLCTVPAAGALADTLASTLADALASATLLIEDGDASAALVIVADQGRDGDDRGTALLLGPTTWPAAGSPAGQSGIPVHGSS